MGQCATSVPNVSDPQNRRAEVWMGLTDPADVPGPQSRVTGPLFPLTAGDRWYGRSVTRTDLHRLVDALPEESLDPVAVLLQRAHDPGLANRDAGPWEDESISAEEDAAAAEARGEADRGEVIAWDDIKRELLTD